MIVFVCQPGDCKNTDCIASSWNAVTMPNSAAMALQLQNILNEKKKQCRELTKELQEEGKDVSLEELTLSSLRPSFVLSFVFDPANSINTDVDKIL